MGGFGLLPLGFRCDCHSPWAVFNSLLMAVATSGEAVTCKFFTFAVLLSQFAQVTVIAKNMSLDRG